MHAYGSAFFLLNQFRENNHAFLGDGMGSLNLLADVVGLLMLLLLCVGVWWSVSLWCPMNDPWIIRDSSDWLRVLRHYICAVFDTMGFCLHYPAHQYHWGSAFTFQISMSCRRCRVIIICSFLRVPQTSHKCWCLQQSCNSHVFTLTTTLLLMYRYVCRLHNPNMY